MSELCALMAIMTAADVAGALPGIDRLRDLCRSLAVLDAILCPDPVDRHHGFTAEWSAKEEAATMADGSGDEYSIVFSAAGAYVRGFAHESPMSPYGDEDHEPWPGVVDTVPDAFRHLVNEPAFSDEEGMPVVTACLWRETHDDRWRVGDIDYPPGPSDPDGADGLFALLTEPTPEAYHRFAEDYFETGVDLEVVRQVYALRPLTQEMVTRLNGALVLADLAEDLSAARYPIGS